MGKKSKKRPLKEQQMAEELNDFAEFSKQSHSDVDGSYTGNPLYGEMPVQDADDL